MTLKDGQPFFCNPCTSKRNYSGPVRPGDFELHVNDAGASFEFTESVAQFNGGPNPDFEESDYSEDVGDTHDYDSPEAKSLYAVLDGSLVREVGTLLCAKIAACDALSPEGICPAFNKQTFINTIKEAGK